MTGSPPNGRPQGKPPGSLAPEKGTELPRVWCLGGVRYWPIRGRWETAAGIGWNRGKPLAPDGERLLFVRERLADERTAKPD